MAEHNIRGKVVVITGASSGFGKGTALQFAEEGASLALAARRGELLEELARECESRGTKALAVPTDVSRPEEVERLAETAIQAFGRIDVWVNNAGVGAIGRFERIPLEVHDQVVRTDLLGTLYGSYYAYQQFLKQGGGILINVASETGRHTVPYYSSYAAAKHGVVGLSDALRQEIEQNEIEGVHVCTVMIDTIVRLAHDPKDAKIVGADGVVKILMKKVAPELEERMVAKQIHKMQYEQAPLADDSPGAVRSPIPQGTGVSAGRRSSDEAASR